MKLFKFILPLLLLLPLSAFATVPIPNEEKPSFLSTQPDYECHAEQASYVFEVNKGWEVPIFYTSNQDHIMKQPQFKKGDKVLATVNGKEVEDKILNTFPVGRGPTGVPIIKRVEETQYSYQLDGHRALRFNEDELKVPPTTPSKADKKS